jgi:hypothetical protein
VTTPSVHRPLPADAPGARLAVVIQLVDELDDITRAAAEVAAGVEEATGLRRGELAALTAVADGARSARDVGRDVGQPDDAAAVTAGSLVHRGLLRRAGDRLELTEEGRVVVQQVEGLRIRLLDSVVGALGPRATGQLRAAVQALTGALAGAAGARAAICRENDSRGVGAGVGP